MVFAALLKPSVRSAATSGAVVKVTVLSALRSGEAEKAAHLLESLLDGDIVTLGTLRRSSRDANLERAVEMAAVYRRKYPYQSGALEVDKAVKDILTSGRSSGTRDR